jgi:hypothetical protein
VAFIVNVKLVENNVNRKVGIVRVLNVIVQYSIDDTTPMMDSNSRPRNPNQERCPSASAAAAKVATAAPTVEFMINDLLLQYNR